MFERKFNWVEIEIWWMVKGEFSIMVSLSKFCWIESDKIRLIEELLVSSGRREIKFNIWIKFRVIFSCRIILVSTYNSW